MQLAHQEWSTCTLEEQACQFYWGIVLKAISKFEIYMKHQLQLMINSSPLLGLLQIIRCVLKYCCCEVLQKQCYGYEVMPLNARADLTDL